MKNTKDYGVYTGKSLFSNGDFYIHLHQKNIGRADNHPDISKPNIAKIMHSQKKQAVKTSKTNYKRLLRESVSGESVELLNTLFNNDNFISKLNSNFIEAFQKNLDLNTNQKELMDLYRAANPKNSFKKAMDAGKTRIEGFNNFIEGLNQAAELLDSPEGTKLAEALAAAKMNPSGGASMTTLGQRLEKAVSKFLQENEGASFSEQQVYQAAQHINYLAQALKTNGQGEGISERSYNTYIDHIFNLGYAEGISSVSNQLAVQNLEKIFIDYTKSKRRLSGNAPVISATYTPSNELLAIGKEDEKYGKTDSKLKNVQVSTEYIINGITGTVNFNIDLGFSTKFYRGHSFRGENKTGKAANEFSTGSLGIKLGEAINYIYGTNYSRYLAYNVISRGKSNEWREPNAALIDVILTRFLINAVSSRSSNKEDFSQFIIANGTIISVWDLILFSENNSLGISNSLSSFKDNQPINLSISNRNDIESGARKRNILDRVRSTNNAINNASMSAYIHLDKMKNMIK